MEATKRLTRIHGKATSLVLQRVSLTLALRTSLFGAANTFGHPKTIVLIISHIVLVFTVVLPAIVQDSRVAVPSVQRHEMLVCRAQRDHLTSHLFRDILGLVQQCFTFLESRAY